MTTDPNRVDAGVPTGGQFAAKIKSDNVPSLSAPARRPELEGWPERLPEPEVSFHMGDDNVITTSVNINGEPVFEAWNPGDDIHSLEMSCFETPERGWTHDESVAAETWAKSKHEEIAAALRSEMHAAVERARAGVLAKVTGQAQPLSDEKLGELIGLNQAAAYAARRDAELAATAVIARGVLKDHPGALYIGLGVSSADNGEFVSGVTVFNDADEVIGSYDTYDEDVEEDAEEGAAAFVEHIGSLEPQPENAWWSDYRMPGFDPDNAYTINLEKAARWTPAAPR